MELTHKTVADTKIGRYEQQGIDCTGTGGTFQITYNGVSTGALQFNDAFVNLETALNGLSTLGPNAVSVSNPNSLANVCASGNFIITFNTEGDKLPLEFVTTSLTGGTVTVSEKQKGGLIVYYSGGNTGLYHVGYVPTVKGQYDMTIKIDNVDIETDLSAGIWVYSAISSAIHSTHTATTFATEGVMEYFTIQAIDRFENELDTSIGADETFFAVLEGTADSRSGLSGDIVIHPKMAEKYPNTDGTYQLEYHPKIAGNYTLSLTQRSAGGLLATYYINDDLSSNVSGVEPHCKSSMVGNCDSTQIDKNIDFDWGNYGPAFAAFPNEYFSVLWRGEIKSSAAGSYRFSANAKNGIRVFIDGNAVIDEWLATSTEVSGAITLKANTFYTIRVEYREVTAKASVKLSWLVSPDRVKKLSYHPLHCITLVIW